MSDAGLVDISLLAAPISLVITFPTMTLIITLDLSEMETYKQPGNIQEESKHTCHPTMITVDQAHQIWLAPPTPS